MVGQAQHDPQEDRKLSGLEVVLSVIDTGDSRTASDYPVTVGHVSH